MEIRGWLFDLYPLQSSMILWIKDGQGSLHRFEDPFRPRFHARGERGDLLALFNALQGDRRAAGYRWTRKREFWSGNEMEVMEIEVRDADQYIQLPGILAPWEERVLFYNCDIPVVQAYLYEKGLSPTGRCLGESDGRRIFDLHPDPGAPAWMDEDLPPDLRIMELRADVSPIGLSPEQRGWSGLMMECEGYRVEMEEGDAKEIHRFLKRFDPDVVLSDGGDAFLLPFLFRMAQRQKIAIPWDREPYPARRPARPRGYSYFSYGRTCYKAPAHLFFGRWHIDRQNSFLHRESGLEGLLELARMAKVPVQRMARTSPGTAITSMQLDRAFQEGILVPWRKGEPERFKTAWELLIADKGGLVFQPRLGIFKDVAEIDFTSMYPTMMAIHNISPETVLCKCCENHRVPEVGYSICEKREGIVPRTLKPVLARRALLKKMAKGEDLSPGGGGRAERGREEETGIEKRRETCNRKQAALKWMLVTSFGYLGYRNARFGRIEAHEAVTAFGREKLLTSKEVCEEEGFELLHALTDSLWIRKGGLNEEAVLELCRKISDVTGVSMGLEGIYRWVAFLPSKRNPTSPVASRYFGVFRNGKIKARGLSFRRSDTPPLIREAQLRMVEILGGAETIEACRSRIPRVLELLLEYHLLLGNGHAHPEDLAIGKTISREPDAYRVDSLTALAAQQLEDSGIPVHPGERVRYMIQDARSREKSERVRPFPLVGPNDTYDTGEYQKLLLKAVEELLIPFGYDFNALEAILNPPSSAPVKKGKTTPLPFQMRLFPSR